MLTAIIAVASSAWSMQAEPTELYRKFVKGETYSYSVKAHMLTEESSQFQSAIPQEVDINYDFTAKITNVQDSGFASLIYSRPTITEIEGETADHGPIPHVEKVDMLYELGVSPINEVTDRKDLSKDKDKKDGGGGEQQLVLNRAQRLMGYGIPAKTALQLGGFQSDLYRLCLFVGSFDSALDFNPKLPLDEVKVGDTWKKTVSYQPQKIKGDANNKQAVQRLDMVYKYEGQMQVDGKTITRVSASVSLDTDAAEYINQMLGMRPSQSGLKSFPLKFHTDITFDLDPKTNDTLLAKAKTKGEWSIEIAGQSTAAVKELISGEASMKLNSKK